MAVCADLVARAERLHGDDTQPRRTGLHVDGVWPERYVRADRVREVFPRVAEDRKDAVMRARAYLQLRSRLCLVG